MNTFSQPSYSSVVLASSISQLYTNSTVWELLRQMSENLSPITQGNNPKGYMQFGEIRKNKYFWGNMSEMTL